MTNFKREPRYAVAKWKDLAAALNPAELDVFKHLMWKMHDHRETRGATRFVECVVVEADWPEFEPTWAAIEARVAERDSLSRALGTSVMCPKCAEVILPHQQIR